MKSDVETMACERLQRYERPFTRACTDLDNFKKVNGESAHGGLYENRIFSVQYQLVAQPCFRRDTACRAPARWPRIWKFMNMKLRFVNIKLDALVKSPKTVIPAKAGIHK
jgi:hypothetical protein